MTRMRRHIPSLTSLSPNHQLVFALLIFDRMLPGLLAFCRETGLDCSPYIGAKDMAWRALQNGPVDLALRRVCVESAPDTEQFSQPLTSHALNTALAMGEILEFASDWKEDHIENIRKLVRDSVYLYLSTIEPSLISSPSEVKRISEHSLMLREEQKEDEDISFLWSVPTLDGETISSLKRRAAAQSPVFPVPQ